ncbi:VOC family protein [Microbacterium sp. NPDC056044]|uniref:VOC family protein n=1 Tax=Microbacterium sp. NPDC056044 TaxID=3345690 RepID=UPI0035D5F966
MNRSNAAEPAGRNTVNGFIITDDAAQLIDFLVDVFDAAEDPAGRAEDYVAGDGSLIHSEIIIGNSVVMVADRKADWPFTPAFTQVYVSDPSDVLARATARGAHIVTDVSPFYGGYDIARFLDPWRNLWWLFAPRPEGADSPDAEDAEADESWENADPSPVYTTLLDAMRSLRDPRRGSE